MISEIATEALYYSTNHEWCHVDENLITVGLTDVRLKELGEILYLDLPDEGKTVHQGESFFSMESLKSTHDFSSPVGGMVLEVNDAIQETPGILNDDPFNEGWLVRIEMESEKDLAHLMRFDSYKKFVISPGSWQPRVAEIATILG